MFKRISDEEIKQDKVTSRPLNLVMDGLSSEDVKKLEEKTVYVAD